MSDTAKALSARGYRVISRRYRTIARIDRPDWIDVLRAANIRAKADRHGNAQDLYRRVYSRDTRTVSESVMRAIPNSSGDPVGYVP